MIIVALAISNAGVRPPTAKALLTTTTPASTKTTAVPT
jgi:hypothetical protein